MSIPTGHGPLQSERKGQSLGVPFRLSEVSEEIRQMASEYAREALEARVHQGLPPKITDQTILDVIAAALEPDAPIEKTRRAA